MALGMEELERIDVALRDSQRARRAVEVDRVRGRRVEPAEVHGQLAIDEHPEIVVAAEPERLATVVLELRVQLGRETEVVLA